MKYVFRYPAIFMAILFALGSPALADEVEPIGDSIITFLENANQPISPYAALKKNPSVKLIDEVSEAVFTSDPARIETALTKISSQPPVDLDDFQQTLSFSKQIAEVYQTLAATEQDDSNIERRNAALIKFFDSFAYDDNWYLQSVSYSLGAFIHIADNRLLIAGEQIDKAMNVIPTELSSEVTDARLLASEVAMILHGLQGNPEFLLDAARVLQKSKLEVGETINRYELMTNFVYALNRARDYESASKVATLLVDEPRSADTVFGVAEVYMAETFNETGDYSNARILAEKALAGSTHPVVDGRGNRELLVALAGLGDIKAARSLMRDRGWDYSAKEFLETVESQTLLHAEALIAMHQGESGYALSLMKRRADLLVGRVQSANSASMTDMLSNLENTRERQAERENALQREAEMRAVQLEQKTKLNRLLWVLIGFLTIAFNFLLAFLRYREKLNVKVQELQEDALSAEKMKTEFLGIINHELRTPLNGIIGISDAMIHHAPSQIMREQATAVQESGQLLFDLLDSLITMSTIESDRLTLDAESGKLSKTIANEAAEWTGAAEDKGIEFTAFIGTELDDPVVTDHKRIRQCLRYLLSNAVRFTHAGRVHLHATGAQDSDGMMAVTIIVADTGQGISEAVQKRLFKPFLQADATMTRKYGGAGLSLAITRKLAEMMGGDVTVKSREGRGSEFTFTAKLPMAEIAQADIDDTELAQTVSGMAEADTPEAIIDLMLEQQLPAAASAQQPRYKAAG